MKMRNLCLAALSFASVLVLGACSNETSSKDTTFKFGTWAAGEELKELNEIIERVNENANGEYEIEVLSIPSDYYIKLSTLIASKNVPDFFWLTQELISKYAQMGVIADLTSLLNTSERLNPNNFYEGVIASAQFEGNYYGVPWIANPLMVYYNKDLFKEAGIDQLSPTDDWTWDEFINIAKQLTVEKIDKHNNPYQQYGYIVEGWPNIETFFWAGGGDIIAENGVDVTVDSEASIKGLDILNNILKSGISPEYAEVSSLGSRNVWFEKGRVAMFMGGIQDNFEEKIQALPEEEQFEIGYAPMPVGLDGQSHSFDWTASTVMKKEHQDNELAFKALEALTLEFFKWKVAPPIKGQVETVLSIDQLKQEALPTIEHALSTARSANYIPEWNEINHWLWYDLYVNMLNDYEFDYVPKVKEIAEKSRELIANRK